MKRTHIVLLLLYILLPVKGQKVFDCEPVKVQKLDSIINFAREAGTDIYVPVDVFIYQYDMGRYPIVERLSLPSRTPVNRQNYFFDESGLKTHYILQVWNGTDYSDNSRTDYFYNDEGYQEREVFSGLGESGWAPYQQHWYNYDESNVVRTYLRQMMYSAGVWTDFSYKNYIYNGRGQLIERNEQRIADDVIFWVELFTYDDRGRTATRIRQSLKYYPATRTYAMVNLNKQIYTYDIYGELSEYGVETWINDSWVLTGKSVYYRSLLYGEKVAVCFKGKTKIIPVQSVEKMLERGGQLGACECQPEVELTADLKQSGISPWKADSVTEIVVYPNPASTQLNVRISGSMDKYSDLHIYNRLGSLIIKEKISDQTISLDISHLKPGSYHLSVSGEGGSYMTTFVKNQ